ncbi:MAG: hypothetical protein Q9166_008164 [cf. Caloplaca sp. 2 TL-2023]
MVAFDQTSPSTDGSFTPSSNPQLSDEDDPRFSIRVTMSDTKLPPTAVLMNAVELTARYAELEFLGFVTQRHGMVLPQFPQIEIAVIPAPPARSVEVRLVIYTIYATVLQMMYKGGFHESEIEVLWENQVKAHVYFTRPLDGTRGADSQSKDFTLPVSGNTTLLQESTNSTAQPLNSVFDWKPVYKPNGENIHVNDVFLLALASIKVIAPYPVTEKISGPFHVGSELIDANLQIYLQDRPITRPTPPFLRYGHVLEAVRRIPGWELARRRFAEFFCTIELSRRSVGVVLMERGSFFHN